METFSGNVAIVTGAGSGIGRALAEELARRGASVVLADRNQGRIEEVAQRIRGAGHPVKAVPLDVSDFDSVKRLVDETVAEYRQLDFIFNNAGIAVGGEARDCSIEDWRAVLDVNLYGVINGVVAAYPVMVKQGRGHIVNTSSLAGLVPVPCNISYVASKFAVVGLSNALRVEGKGLGVKVSVVCPGLIRTAIFHDSKLLKMDRQKALEHLTQHKVMEPEECALAILRGVERNQAIIVVTRFARIVWILQRIFPGLVSLLMRHHMKRFRREIRLQD